MLHDERILKNKFAYFFTIIFILGWMIFYAYHAFNILLRGYRIEEAYSAFEVPVYILYFTILPLLIIAFVCIFKESRNMFKYLYISLLLMTFYNAIFFYSRYQKNPDLGLYIRSFLFVSILFVVGPAILINYFKHQSAKSEIDNIGRQND
ncbi:MAG: hypothetical protein K0R77_436 [Chryseobacterium sp.]|jgi:hypothetical protein|uniref:hypothetical protein n=1 Tax=Chryseobacterium sp. TaxID=1871047 RepID=UPI0026197B77|nr:hypothetical protein [Chryseobacterium sp.]MDF2551161.1 hypothetical protein [Chryseobacterium sp.]